MHREDDPAATLADLADLRRELEREIARLRDDLANLRSYLERLEGRLPPRGDGSERELRSH